MATANKLATRERRTARKTGPARRPTDASEPEAEHRRRRGFWSGTIAFGLVSVPVELLPATRTTHVALRLLSPDGVPLARRYWCPRDKRFVDWEDLVRGYEVADGRYIVLTDEELTRLAPEKSREIDLRQFVPRESIDPALFESAYFLAPAGSTTKAYRLLAEAMQSSRKAGIGTFVMRGKEYLAAILARNGVLRLETLRFADEIRSAEDMGIKAPGKPEAQRLRAMTRAVRQLKEETLDSRELHDRYSERVEALAMKKLEHGVDIVELPEEARRELEKGDEAASIIDLMETLKRSLGATPAASRDGAARRTSGATSSHGRRKSPRKAGARSSKAA
jgi:DNA end-binding protein Ku